MKPLSAAVAEPRRQRHTGVMTLKYKLQNVTRNLHDLLKSLPTVKATCSAEVIDRHLQLIAYFQRQYDQLIKIEQPAPAAS